MRRRAQATWQVARRAACLLATFALAAAPAVTMAASTAPPDAGPRPAAVEQAPPRQVQAAQSSAVPLTAPGPISAPVSAPVSGPGPVPAPAPVPLPAGPAPQALRPAAAELAEGEVSLSVDSLAPEVMGVGQDLVVSGSIANGTDAPISAADLVIRVQRSTDVNGNDLSSWMSGARDVRLEHVLTSALDQEVQPGGLATFTATVPAASLPLSQQSQWGPRGVEVRLMQGSQTSAEDRTIMLWYPGVDLQASRVTAVVPVVASTTELTALVSAEQPDGDRTEALQALHTRVLGLLKLARPGLVLAVDPALLALLGVNAESLEAVRKSDNGDAAPPTPSATGTVPSDDGSQAGTDPSAEADASPSPPTASASAPGEGPSPGPAPGTTDQPVDPGDGTPVQPPGAPDPTELVEALSTAISTGDVFALPWDDADLAALAHLDQADLAAVALNRAEAAASQWPLTTASQANGDAGDPSADPSADPQATATPAQEAPAAPPSDSHSQAPAMTTALANGPLDSQTLDSLPATITTVIADPGDLQVTEPLTYTPSGTTTVAGRAVLIPDAPLSATASGQGIEVDGAFVPLNDLDTRQLLRSQTAILTRQAPNRARDVVVSLDREEVATIPSDELAARIDALLNTPWSSAQALAPLVGHARQDETNGTQVARAPLPGVVVGEGELAAEDLAAAHKAQAHVHSVSSVLSEPASLLGTSAHVLSTTTACLWRTDPAARVDYLNLTVTASSRVGQSLTAAPSSTLNIIAASASVPIRVVNPLDQEVTVKVHLVPDSTRMQVVRDVAVTVPARGEATASVPIKAIGSGDVEVWIQLLADDGTQVGTPSALRARVRASWETVGTQVIAGVLVVMLVAGVTRTIRRGRRSQVIDTAEKTA